MAFDDSGEFPGGEKIAVTCSCGGTTTINIDPGQISAAAECACGRVVLWSRGESRPATLGISVGEHIRTTERL